LSQSSLDFLNLLVRSPGDILYFLVMVAVSQAGLFMALAEWWRRPQNYAAGRYTQAMIGIVVTWVLLMIAVLFSLVANENLATILPPLERAATLVILLLAGWAFVTADQSRFGRAPNLILLGMLFIVLLGYAFTGLQWANAFDQTNFNLTSYAVAWTFSALALSVLGIILTVAFFNQTTDAPLKLVFFAILMTSFGATLLQMSQLNIVGNYAGVSRLGMFIALPILGVIVYRKVINQMQVELATRPAPVTAAAVLGRSQSQADSAIGVPPLNTPLQRDSVQLLKTLGMILEDSAPNTIPERIVSAVLEVLKADAGVILRLQDANYADITAGYNRTMKRRISGLAVNLDVQPTLVNAIERRAQRILTPGQNEGEIRDLHNRLDIESIGPTYLQPLTKDKELVAVLLIALPYSQRTLDESETELLKGIGIIAGNLLALSYAARDARLKAEERAIQAMLQGVPIDDISDSSIIAARQETQSSLQAAREQIKDLTGQISRLKIELDSERIRLTESVSDTEDGLSVSQRIVAISDDQQRLRTERDALLNRLQEAEAALASVTASSNEEVITQMVEMLRREKDDLVGQRDRLQQELDTLRGVHNPDALALSSVATDLDEESARITLERNALESRLNEVFDQLRAFGIEDSNISGLAQVITQLGEQRTLLQSRVETLMMERDALLNERIQQADSIAHEKQRTSQINALQTDVQNLAADREALTKERDQLRGERNELLAKQDSIKQNRARLLAEASGYQIELAEAYQEQAKLRNQIQQLVADQKNLRTQIDQTPSANGTPAATTETQFAQINAQRLELERDLQETRTRLAQAQSKVDMLQVRINAQIQTESTEAIQQYDSTLTTELVQELRTPLTSMMGYIELLLDESIGVLGDKQQKFLQRVASNVTRLNTLIDDLKNAAILDTAVPTLIKRDVHIISLVEDAISQCMYQFREKGLALHINLDDSVPAVRADQDALTQVISQLLINAYLASPPDTEVSVSVHQTRLNLLNGESTTDHTEDCIVMSIEDSGGGIPPESIAQIFTRRTRGDYSQIQGLGDSSAGLAIARMLIEAHSGTIWVETQPGVSSTFHLALPIGPVQEPVEAA
jgi:signal transduction histidine kinase